MDQGQTHRSPSGSPQQSDARCTALAIMSKNHWSKKARWLGHHLETHGLVELHAHKPEVDPHLDVLLDLLLPHRQIAHSNTHAEGLIQLELDCSFPLVYLKTRPSRILNSKDTSVWYWYVRHHSSTPTYPPDGFFRDSKAIAARSLWTKASSVAMMHHNCLRCLEHDSGGAGAFTWCQGDNRVVVIGCLMEHMVVERILPLEDSHQIAL